MDFFFGINCVREGVKGVEREVEKEGGKERINILTYVL